MDNVIDFKRHREKRTRIRQNLYGETNPVAADIVLFTGVRVDYEKDSNLKSGETSKARHI